MWSARVMSKFPRNVLLDIHPDASSGLLYTSDSSALEGGTFTDIDSDSEQSVISE
jgi:hypothetical protein